MLFSDVFCAPVPFGSRALSYGLPGDTLSPPFALDGFLRFSVAVCTRHGSAPSGASLTVSPPGQLPEIRMLFCQAIRESPLVGALRALFQLDLRADGSP